MDIIYLMGAGRSGTTLLATVLGGTKHIITIGEMHQFLEHFLEQKPCSCGEEITNCEFWSPVINDLTSKYTPEELYKINEYNENVESHINILKSLFYKNKSYLEYQTWLYDNIQRHHPSQYVLDSSKYVSRALQLRRMTTHNVKLIYITRDVRGVIHSFGKRVQTSKSPFSALIYYAFINKASLFVSLFLKKDCIKRIAYEDFIKDSKTVLNDIGSFLNINLDAVNTKLTHGESFQVPHIIGGNRLVKEKAITLKKDIAWKKDITRPKQILYYLLVLPLMIVFKYKP